MIGFWKVQPEWFGWNEDDSTHSSKKHLVYQARRNIEMLFTDNLVYKPSREMDPEHNQFVMALVSYHEPLRPRRDPSVKVPGKKECKRCGRRSNLEREHIVPLSKGGKDASENLQWLCRPCHDYKHAEENILDVLAEEGLPGWKRGLWEYRLKVLRELNPPGSESYRTYFSDPKTHHEAWYERPKVVKEPNSNMKLELFIEQASP